MCWTLNHQNIIEIAQWHISLSETRNALYVFGTPSSQHRLGACELDDIDCVGRAW
jgi:hypothetical protein